MKTHKNIFLAIAALLLAMCLSAPPARAQGGDHLSLGIAAYRAGRQAEALAELNEAVNAGSGSTLAYYYAARIRLEQGAFSRAARNLQAALQDSAGFADAAGLLAVVRDREGNRTAASDWWRRFVEDAGTDPAVPSGTIMMPEDYRARLAEAAASRDQAAREENERQEAAQREAVQNTAPASPPETPPSEETAASGDMAGTIGTPGETGGEAAEAPPGIAADDGEGGFLPIENAIEQDVDTLGNRVHAGIRRGLYSIVTAIMLLFCGIAGIALYVRHRRRQRETSLGFAEEIDTALRDRIEEEEIALELTGESAEHTFAEQSRRIKGFERGIGKSRPRPPEPPLPPPPQKSEPAPQPQRSGLTFESPPKPEPEPEPAESAYPYTGHESRQSPAPDKEPAWEAPPDREEAVSRTVHRDSERPPITEEVKALVTRMSREGRNINDICRAADLTRTEVELIIAVRSRHTENVVLDYAREREEDADADRLYDAVRELAADGESEIGIARKLGISRTEAALAIKVMQKWR